MIARRDTSEKLTVPLDGVVERVQALLSDIQRDMFEAAKRRLEENSHVAETLDDSVEIIQTKRGFVLAGWCGDDACERAVKDACTATSRCIPFDSAAQPKTCVTCGKPAKHAVWFAKSY